jgi:site-specific DNA-methyltransferase (adenine-specific)
MKPYYQDASVTIFHGDCRDVLPTLDKVDLVLTSPPYNLGSGHHTGNIRHNAYSDDMPEVEYQRWQTEVLGLLWDSTHDSGSLLYNHKNRIKNGVQITPYEWLLKTDWLVKQELVWRNGSQNFDKIRFYPMTERIYWLAKRSDTTLQNVINQHDIFEWNSVGTTGQPHTRAFPIRLVTNLTACFPDAKTILDPFMGSGTTLRAAKDLNRKAIGIELEEKYCEIAAKRMSQLAMQL